MLLKSTEAGFEAEGEDTEFTCCRCGHIIQKKEAGFKCTHRVLCEACETQWEKENIYDNKICHLDALTNYGEHLHTKFTRKK